ncbi:MAG: hypothetical protein WBM07_10605 [Chitinivibrionales bacterium]
MRFKSVCLFLQLFALILFLTGTARASDEKSDTPEKVSVGGYAFWQFGQIVQGWDRNEGQAIFHDWTNNVLIGLSIKAQPSDRLQIVLSPEFYLNYCFPQQRDTRNSVSAFGFAYINEADGVFSFGDLDKPFLQASLGMFTFKYNPDGRNFGDYLFRTGTYPTYITTDFDFPAARLLGLHLSSDPIANLHADILLTSEAFMYPLFDFSLTGIASYKLFNAIEIGAGIDFARLLPVDNSKTSPQLDLADFPTYSNSYIEQNGDTGYYSFKATKVMARVSIDPKQFFGSPKFFGPEDLKLYGEICWVGVGGYNAQNLPPTNIAWYNDLNQRTPRMLGLNVPTFRALDVLSAEVEYFPSVIPNDYEAVDRGLSPMPYLNGGLGSYNIDNWNQGFWRWSVYAKKMIVKGFSVTGEAAFDHLRMTFWDGTTNEYESLIKKGDWHWELKFGYSF